MKLKTPKSKAPEILSVMEIEQEFERQTRTLLKNRYAKATALETEELLLLIKPLKAKAKKIKVPRVDLEKGLLPFVLVLKDEILPTEKAMSLVRRQGKSGITILRPLSPSSFQTIEKLSIPKQSVYLLVDIDRGGNSVNLPPNKALKLIQKKKRTPATIDEGVAIVTHFPDFLRKNNCFSLLASRTGKDQRVPAIWINANKRPNLGWCWDGNPHTWLGSASAARRIGAR